MSERTTLAPSRAKASAQARPMPAAAPVTTATLSLSRICGFLPLEEIASNLLYTLESEWLHANGLEALRYSSIAIRSEARSREPRSEEHTSELQSRENLVCRLLLE